MNIVVKKVNLWGERMLEENEIYNNFVNEFSSKIYNLKSDYPFSNYIFLCVGSDKIIGDAYGPLVGERLEKLLKNSYNNIQIIGTLQNPISGINLKKEVEKIYKSYKKPCIIAIDAALSNKENIGKIVVTDSKMKFGKGTNKNIVEVGNISIKGIVATDYKNPRYNFNELQNASLNRVLNLANITSDGIYNVIKYK